MADRSSASAGRDDDSESSERATRAAPDDDPSSASAPDAESPDDGGDLDLDALRSAVEEKYDFDDFGPEDMAEMSLDEWEAAFDPDSWVVGEELLDRVQRELRARVASREVFAVLERIENEDGEQRLLAYSDEGYALIYPDGSVEGEGTVFRDVQPTVALCSMDDYEVMDAPADVSLPDPTEVPEGSGEFGNLMLQIVAGVQVLVGLGLLVGWILLPDLDTIVAPIAALGFLVIGFFLFLVVANARLSDRFRAEQYRDRLRAIGVEEGERPEFLPPEVRSSTRIEPSDDGPDASTESRTDSS
jgi:hypothetical protein